MKLNQKGINDVVVMTIIGGIIGAIFIAGVFVWREIENNPQPIIKDSNASEQELCLNAGGQWREMGSTCVDRCGKEDNICGWALTVGCDCGQNECWNGSSCVSN